MSHISTIQLKVNSLEALGKAAEDLGCELVRGVKKYKWYGGQMSGQQLPAGFTTKDLGKCEHVIRVKGADAKTYEIGVAAARDGSGGYVLMTDFFAGGYGLVDKVGNNASFLKQGYAAEVAIAQARRKGLKNCQKVRNADGSMTLTLSA